MCLRVDGCARKETQYGGMAAAAPAVESHSKAGGEGRGGERRGELGDSRTTRCEPAVAAYWLPDRQLSSRANCRIHVRASQLRSY